MEYHDYTHLSTAEAYQKLSYLQLKVYMDQHNVDFFVKSPLPDQYLKSELIAFWEGRIQEFHGFEDPLGQAARWIVDQISSAFGDFYSNTIAPALNDLFSPVSDGIAAINSAVSGIPDLAKAFTDFMGGLSDTIAAAVVEPLNNVNTWINDAVSGIPDLLAADFTALQDSMAAGWDSIIESVNGGLEVITKGFEALPAAIESGFQNALSYLGDVGKWIWENVLVPSGEGIRDLFLNVFSGLTETVGNLVNVMLSIPAAFAPITPQKSADLAQNMGKLALTSGLALGGAFLVGELLHPLKNLGLGHVAAMIYKASNYDQITGAIVSSMTNAALKVPLTYNFNNLYRPWLPSKEDAMKFRTRGLISDAQLKDLLAFYGYADDWHNLYLESTKSIPSVQDLVRFVVRECFPLENLPSAPSEFIKSLQMWNMDEAWANAYWEAHWEMPAFQQLVTAFHRGIINESELQKYIVWWDYKPTQRPGISKSDVEIMRELIYDLPDKLTARWMLRWGVIDKSTYKKLIAATGIHPDWLDRVADAEYMNNLSEERTGLRTAVNTMYTAGYYTEQQVKSILKQYKFLDDEIDIVLQTNEYKRIRDEQDDYVQAAITAYRYGKISLDELAAELSKIGLQDWKISSIIAIEKARAKSDTSRNQAQEMRSYGYSIAMRRFEDGISDEQDLAQELRMLGYSDAQIAVYTTAARLERDRRYANAVLSALRTAWNKGYIGDDTFINTLQQFGFSNDKIALELNLLKLKRGMMPPQEGE